MDIITHTTLDDLQKKEVMRLWNNEYPAHINYSSIDDFDKYLIALIPKAHYLLIEYGIIHGWLFVFSRSDEDWFAILLDSAVQKKGYGTRMLNKAKENHPVLNGWVIDHNEYKKANGKAYESPLSFYLKNGFATDPSQKFPSDTLSAVKITWQSTSG